MGLMFWGGGFINQGKLMNKCDTFLKCIISCGEVVIG